MFIFDLTQEIPRETTTKQSLVHSPTEGLMESGTMGGGDLVSHLTRCARTKLSVLFAIIDAFPAR